MQTAHRSLPFPQQAWTISVTTLVPWYSQSVMVLPPRHPKLEAPVPAVSSISLSRSCYLRDFTHKLSKKPRKEQRDPEFHRDFNLKQGERGRLPCAGDKPQFYSLRLCLVKGNGGRGGRGRKPTRPPKNFLGKSSLPKKYAFTCHAVWMKSSKNNLAHSEQSTLEECFLIVFDSQTPTIKVARVKCLTAKPSGLISSKTGARTFLLQFFKFFRLYLAQSYNQ